MSQTQRRLLRLCLGKRKRGMEGLQPRFGVVLSRGAGEGAVACSDCQDFPQMGFRGRWPAQD